MNKTVLIASIGWEPRFLLSLEDILANDASISEAIFFHPNAFIARTSEPLKKARELINQKSVDFTIAEIELTDHVLTWRSVEQTLKSVPINSKVILDITTMPRHLIWVCLHFLELSKAKVQCIYYRPQAYGDWLSGDNGKPKLLFRHSGIAYPDRQTCLLLFSGFDVERTNQIVDAFEPAKTILILQDGDQLDNNSRCVKSIAGRSEITTTTLNAFSDISTLKNQLEQLVIADIPNFNVVATTVGPRSSAIALYALNRAIPDIGLSYANSHLYNDNYSTGIDISKKFDAIIDFT
jgi:hypothetical protein